MKPCWLITMEFFIQESSLEQTILSCLGIINNLGMVTFLKIGTILASRKRISLKI